MTVQLAAVERAIRRLNGLEAPELTVPPYFAVGSDLSGDHPFYPVVAEAAAGALEALERGETHYTDVGGIAPLREETARALTGLALGPWTSDHVLVAAGEQEARFLALQTLARAGYRLLLPSVVHPGARKAALVARRSVQVLSVPAGALTPESEDVRKALAQGGPAVLYLESPNRLTGAVIDPGTLDALATEVARAEALLIWDATLAPWVADQGRWSAPPAAIADRTFLFGTLWPGAGVDGWLAAYLAVPVDWVGQARSLKQIIAICTSAPVQWAVLAALRAARDAHAERRAALARTRAEAAAVMPEAVLPGDAASVLAVAVSTAVDLSALPARPAHGGPFGRPDVARFTVTATGEVVGAVRALLDLHRRLPRGRMPAATAASPSAAPKPAPTGTALLYGLMEQAKRFPDAIALGRGDPDFPTPAHIREAIRDALKRNELAPVAPPEGLPELREAIAGRLRATNGIEVDPDTEVVVTQGGQEAIFLMVQAAVGHGDEVIFPEPNYNTYRDAIGIAGATAVPVITKAETAFDVDPAAVAAAITERTRALLLVSPNNPSAGVLSPERVRQLAALAEEHDLLVLADDTYDRFLYEGAVHTSPGSLSGLARRTLTLNTLSKTYAMTGWRLGWIAGPAPLMARIRKLKEAVSGGTSIVAQRGGVAALAGPQNAVEEMYQAYARRRQIVLRELDRMELPYGIPYGGQFVFIDARRLGLGSLELSHRILEDAHVLVYPGVAFGEAWDGFLRVTFLQPEAVLEAGLRRMGDVIASLG